MTGVAKVTWAAVRGDRGDEKRDGIAPRTLAAWRPGRRALAHDGVTADAGDPRPTYDPDRYRVCTLFVCDAEEARDWLATLRAAGRSARWTDETGVERGRV